MRKLKTAAIGLLMAVTSALPSVVQAQCDQPQPSNGCLCIYFCTFSLTKNSCDITVNWTTETEPTGSSSFTIYRSNDAVTYFPITTVAGNPGSSVHRIYSYLDATPYNPTHGPIYYYIKMVSFGTVVAQTNIVVTKTLCTGTLNCGNTAVMNGFSSPLAVGGTEQLSLSGPSTQQPIQWTSSNTSVATVSSTGLLTAIAPGTVTITGRFVTCNVSVVKTLVVPGPNYSLIPNPCNGISTQTPLNGVAGDVVVLQLSFGGFVNWNGISNGAGASIFLSCGGQSNTVGSAHYFGSGGFSLNTQITFTMPSNSTVISTNAVVNNSTTMLSSTASLILVSVNGVPYGNSGVVCGGNSQGAW
jgi:Bacterial Ig-like domain (group 2)